MTKKTIAIMALAMAFRAVAAQTLNVEVGQVTYQIPAAQAGDMTYHNGTSVTILEKEYTLSDVNQMYVDTTSVADNTVRVVYDGDQARVFVAGNVARYVSVSVTGAHVVVIQDGVSDETGKIEYTLTGASADGEFYLSGSYKTDLVLAGLTLTNPSGAAIDIENGKKINVTVKKDTQNTLTDGASGSQKACFVLKGHADFKGQGTLNVYGKAAHGIKTGDYMTVKNLTLNVLEAAKDGIHANEYFLMQSGNVTISGVADDAIQAELDGTASTGETTDHEDEDTGNIYIAGGTLVATVTGTATKCLKSDGTVVIDGGNLSLKAQGGIDLTDTTDPSYTAGIKAAAFVQNAGTVVMTVSGTAGRGVSAATIVTNGGSLQITNSGAGQEGTGENYTAKGLKADTSIALNAGTITISMTGDGGKGIKSSGTYTQGTAGGDGPVLTVSTTGSSIGSSTGGPGGGGGWWWWAPPVDEPAQARMAPPMHAPMHAPGGGGGPGGGGPGGSQNSGGSSAKAIKVQGAVVVYGGTSTITTQTDGAEGLESKTSIDIQGGQHYLKCYDDCINSAGKIVFSGGVTIAYSFGNDAVDSNAGTAGAITIGNGVVFAYTTKGSPEEGLDCDNNSYIRITGTGIGISAGGAQGGGSSSTISNAQQGYNFLTSTVRYTTGNYYTLADASGNNLVTYSFEAACSSTLSLITATGMVRNSSYTIKSSTAAPTDATTAFHGLYLGSTAKGTTSVASFTAK